MILAATSDALNWQTIIFGLAGGFGIFMLGITFMGDGLKLLAGSKLKDMIEKYTSNPVSGLFVGIFTTGLLQSSSGTTALTIGLVRAGLMNFKQAVGIILGANIGTTVTAFLIGLKIKTYALPIMAVGALFYVFSHRKRYTYLGQTLFGFGALFYGLGLMSAAMKPMRELPLFIDSMTALAEHSGLAIIVGGIVTAIVQSSSAVIGIVQELYGQGAIELNGAIPLAIGANIGTTITALLAAIGGSIAARRASAAHTLFNIFGAIVFFIIMTPFVSLIVSITPIFDLNPEMQIAYAHAIFNISMALLFIPFVDPFVNMIKKLFKSKDGEKEYDTINLDTTLVSQSPTLAIEQAKQATIRMAEYVQENMHIAYKYSKTGNHKLSEQYNSLENIVNSFEVQIREFLVLVSHEALNDDSSNNVKFLFQTIKDLERISDHCENMIEFFEQMHDEKETFSEEGWKDYKRIVKLSFEMIDAAIELLNGDDKIVVGRIVEKEDMLDKLEKKAKYRHLERVKTKEIKAGVASTIYVDMLDNIERMGDHICNIANNYASKDDEIVFEDFEFIEIEEM